MIIRWVGDQPQADAEAVAALYRVSLRTVRRRCAPVDHLPQKGQPRGMCGRALYDAYAAADDLRDVAPRPQRALAQLRQGQPPQQTPGNIE